MKRMINLLSLHCLEKPNSCQVEGQKKKALQEDCSTKHHSEIILLFGPKFLIVTGRRRWRTQGLTIAGALRLFDLSHFDLRSNLVFLFVRRQTSPQQHGSIFSQTEGHK